MTLPELPVNYSFISHDAKKSPLYYTDPKGCGMAQFAGYWWHDEPLDVAVKRGFEAWINPGTYRIKDMAA